MRTLPAILIAGAVWAQPPPAIAPPPIYDRTLASVMSERLPSWMRLTGEFRTRVEGRTGFNYVPGNNDGYALFRTRLNVELLPATWLNFYFQGQDSRAPGLDAGRPLTSFKDSFDLRQAFVRLGKANGLVKVTVGRQLFLYGAQRLIGPVDWSNTSRSWDAVKVEIGTADAKLDLFASSVVVIDPTHPDHHHDGYNLHGAYGSFKRVMPRAVVEPYLLWKTGHVSIWTGGLRIAALPGTPGLRGFDYQAELAKQWGTIGVQAHSAAAGYGIVGHSLSKHFWTPRVSTEFSHASGDPNPGSATHRTFDQLLPTNHSLYGLTDPVQWQNINMARLGLDAKPRKRIQVNADYRWYWLASAHDALYNALAGAVRPRAGNTARSVGREIDIHGAWAASSQWRFGAGMGHLSAGRFLKENAKGSNQTFPYLFAQYSF